MSADRERFDEFVREHREKLLRYALVLCRDPHFAQDLAQETFLKMWRAQKTREDTLELVFAATILKNTLIDHLRRQGRERELFARIGEMPVGILPEYPSDNDAARDQIRRFLEKLPPRAKEILFLSVVGGFKPAEIADLTGLKPTTVSNYLHRVRKLIKNENPDLDADM